MNLHCWKCGAALVDVLLPFSRYEECAQCRADQHVCKMCKLYDPALTLGCREDRAEHVQDKEKANFCDYFQASSKAFKPRDDTQARHAREQLAALFGESAADSSAIPALQSENQTEPQTEAERALAELKRLFGDT